MLGYVNRCANSVLLKADIYDNWYAIGIYKKSQILILQLYLILHNIHYANLNNHLEAYTYAV